MSLKMELSDLSKDKGNSSKFVRDFSSLSMEINSDHLLDDFYNDTLYSDRFIAFLCNNATKKYPMNVLKQNPLLTLYFQ
jgi:hypothetical protein